jgi:hypothetical protein
VRRYVNHRDLLTESVLRHIRGRLFEMQTALKTVEASKKELEAVEKALDMEKKIVPNAQAEQDSFAGWLWDAATSNVTRLEQISGIWKRYLKTYKEALVVHGRVTKIFESADLSPPTGADLFGLTGVESTDKPKIDAVYQSFQTAFDKAYQEYRARRAATPIPRTPLTPMPGNAFSASGCACSSGNSRRRRRRGLPHSRRRWRRSSKRSGSTIGVRWSWP